MLFDFGTDLGSILDITFPIGETSTVKSDKIDDFIRRGREIFADFYDYSEVTEEGLKSGSVSVRCTKCNNKWDTDRNSHLWNKKGCPYCYQSHPRITRTKLKILTDEKYGSRYSYRPIGAKCKKLKNDGPNTDLGNYVLLSFKLTIVCNKCGNTWARKIRDHLIKEDSCPKCEN